MDETPGADAARQSDAPREMIDQSSSRNAMIGGTTAADDETSKVVTKVLQYPGFKPFEAFPLELLTRTFQYLEDRDLASVALTCYSFCQSAMPILYSTLRLDVVSVDEDNVAIVGASQSEQGHYTTVSQNLDLVKWLRHLTYRFEKGTVLDQDLENEFRNETLSLEEFGTGCITTLETEVQLFDMIIDIDIPATLKKLTIFFDGYQHQDSFYDRIEAFNTEFLPQMLCVKDISLEWNFYGDLSTVLGAFLIIVAIWAEFLEAVPNVKTVKLHCMPHGQTLNDLDPDEDPIPQPITERIVHVINMMESLTLMKLRSFSAAMDPIAYCQKFDLVDHKVGDRSVSIFQVLNKFLGRHRRLLTSFSWNGPPGQDVSADWCWETQVESLVTMEKAEYLSFFMGEMGSDIMGPLLGAQYFCDWFGKFIRGLENLEKLTLVELIANEDKDIPIWNLYGCKKRTDMAEILPKKLQEIKINLCYRSINGIGPAYIKEETTAFFGSFSKLHHLNSVEMIRRVKHRKICRRLSFKRRTKCLPDGSKRKFVSYHRLELAHINPGLIYENHLKCVEHIDYTFGPECEFQGPDAPNGGNFLREYERDIRDCDAGGPGGCDYLLENRWHCLPIHF
ncbi:hypothetical protein TWF679_000487 [Orbilia oligospora]|uniref:F-box domain-containing protein n=1 Tax=Orbilia oligospora TaxID=2813651 RepID=A0A8H8UXS9_ORBOL|nr:hypothetical protein TWF679_000487 [Orbilia oligospora]